MTTNRKSIPGLPAIYQASEDGGVVRLATAYLSTFRGKQVERQTPEKRLAGSKLSTKGYARVNIEGRVHFVHRLVALAFVPNPEGLAQVNHKNGIKNDNRAANLEWVSNLENRRHAVRTGLQARGNAVGGRLTEADVIKIRALLASGVPQSVVSAAFGVVQQTVSHIARRSTWSHI